MPKAINLAAKLAAFDDHWAPRTVAVANGLDFMVVKAKGAYPAHQHDDTDDIFLVLKGELEVEVDGVAVVVGEGELLVVPSSVRHRPLAREEAHLLLIERSGVPNSGDRATAAPRRFL